MIQSSDQSIGNGRRARVAVVQARPAYLDRSATIDKAAELVGRAGAEGARIVVFPESFVPGFPYWPRAYPLPDRERSLVALELLRDSAVRMYADDLLPVREAARAAGIVVVMGFTELGCSPDLLYNSLAYIDTDGKVVSVHRKLVLTFDEACVWSAGDASGLSVMETEAGRLGGLICGNNSMTLAKASLLLRGEQIHASVWPGYRWMWPQVEIVSRGYAVEGRCYVLVASNLLSRADVPAGHPLLEETVWDVPGGSGIVDPAGEWIAGPVLGEEAVLVADIDLGRAQRMRSVRDAVDVYGRPDLFRLMVNESPQRVRGVPADDVPGAAWRMYS